jgi:hypothetical protein
MQGSFIGTLFGVFIMIFLFLSCGTSKNTSNNEQKMKELKLNNAEIQGIVSPDVKGETYYQLNFTHKGKLRNAVFYYQQHSGVIEENMMNQKRKVRLTAKRHELPRSVYPLLTQGYIVVQFTWLGLETYQIVKDFTILESVVQK